MDYKVLYIPEGIPNIISLFPTVDFNNIEEWFIEATNYDDEVIATTRLNKIAGCCNGKIRIHFINSVGEIDSINFELVLEEEEVKSQSWAKSLKFPLDRTKGGSYRQNITSNEVYDCETKEYGEKDQYWLKEVFETPQAWIEVMLPNGFNEPVEKSYLPIIILDGKLPIKKREKRYEYLVRLKFAMSNSNINLR